MITLKQFHDKCKEWTEKGKEVWIEGLGDGHWKLVIEEKSVTIGDGDNGTTNGKKLLV